MFAVVLVLVVSSASLVLARYAPPEDAFGTQRAVLLQERHRLGFDQPLLQQYTQWLTRSLRFDFGESLRFRRPVAALVRERAGNTALLGISGLLLATLIGIPLFLCGFIPIVGQTVIPVIGALVGGWFLAVELVGVAFARRGLGMRVPGGSEHEHVREDLPCEQALRDDAEPQIPALAVAVVAPAPGPLVLQGLVHREAVEQNEERDEDHIALRLLWDRGARPVDVVLLAGFYVACGLGITVGFHRWLSKQKALFPGPWAFCSSGGRI